MMVYYINVTHIICTVTTVDSICLCYICAEFHHAINQKDLFNHQTCDQFTAGHGDEQEDYMPWPSQDPPHLERTGGIGTSELWQSLIGDHSPRILRLALEKLSETHCGSRISPSTLDFNKYPEVLLGKKGGPTKSWFPPYFFHFNFQASDVPLMTSKYMLPPSCGARSANKAATRGEAKCPSKLPLWLS